VSKDDRPKAAAGQELTTRVTKWRFLYFLFAYPWWRSRSWTLNEEGVVARKGVLSREEETIGWTRISNRSISQSLLGRIFNHGTIKLETAGDSYGDMVLPSVGGAERFYEEIGRRSHEAADRGN
jgi:uncharacterized membrane protein YdbT with pleckstrin-like domain